MDEIRSYNRRAWDRQVEKGNRWTLPVGPAEVEAARDGRWEVLLTPEIPVPRAWFPDPFAGTHVLCLASGGGQQAPLFAAAGAHVTVLDNSPRQLGRDREVAEREGLTLRTLEGDMRDLAPFGDGAFDLVFHPCSNSFVPEVRPVWREAYRVLRPGGALLAGFCNPVLFLFDAAQEERGILEVRHALPYSDLTSISEEERLSLDAQGEPLSFGHTLDDQIGGQLDAGFLLAGFYEDRWSGSTLGRYIAAFAATRAIKPGQR